MKIKNILFDFDGVILDSMPIREKGLEYLFSNFPQNQIDALLSFHKNNGGLSRYVKIRYFYENILGQDISEEEVMEHAGRFSEIMRRELINPQLMIMDTVDFIKSNSDQFPMHIVSGSDGNELSYLCEMLDLSRHFLSITGSPTAKKTLVKQLMLRYAYKPEETVLIGDSINDYEAAVDNSILFLAYRFFNEGQIPEFEHLEKMAYILNYC